LDQVKKGDRYFSKIKFEEGMDLSGVDLQNLSFYACEMPGAKFDGAKLALTEFSRMSLATATGLERALNLGFAIFMRVSVTTEQMTLIEKAVKEAKQPPPSLRFPRVKRIKRLMRS
jgi:hypothetical protein